MYTIQAVVTTHMNLKNWIVATNQALLDAAAFGGGFVVLTNEPTGLEVRRLDPRHVLKKEL